MPSDTLHLPSIGPELADALSLPPYSLMAICMRLTASVRPMSCRWPMRASIVPLISWEKESTFLQPALEQHIFRPANCHNSMPPNGPILTPTKHVLLNILPSHHPLAVTATLTLSSTSHCHCHPHPPITLLQSLPPLPSHHPPTVTVTLPSPSHCHCRPHPPTVTATITLPRHCHPHPPITLPLSLPPSSSHHPPTVIVTITLPLLLPPSPSHHPPAVTATIILPSPSHCHCNHHPSPVTATLTLPSPHLIEAQQILSGTRHGLEGRDQVDQPNPLSKGRPVLAFAPRIQEDG